VADSPDRVPEKSGAGMYLLFALLLAGAATGLYFITRKAPPPPPPMDPVGTALPPPVMDTPAPPPPPSAEPEPEVDAGTDAGPGKKVASGGGGGSCAKCGEGKPSGALNSAIRNAAGAAQGCYRRALRQNAASGSMTVSVQVGSTGNVCGASIVNDTVGSSEISNCVLGRFRGQNFPPPEAGCVVVNVPIAFKLQE
jgi:outer membrane biosynthesis protein TonB